MAVSTAPRAPDAVRRCLSKASFETRSLATAEALAASAVRLGGWSSRRRTAACRALALRVRVAEQGQEE